MFSRRAVEILTKQTNAALGKLTFAFLQAILTSLKLCATRNIAAHFGKSEKLATVVRCESIIKAISSYHFYLIGLFAFREAAMNMLDARREETTGRLEWLLSLEDGEPFTLSSELLRTFFFGGKKITLMIVSEVEYRSRLLSLLYRQREQSLQSVSKDESGMSLVKRDVRGLHVELSGATLISRDYGSEKGIRPAPMSEVDSALDVMATVGAYFQGEP